MFFIGQGLFYRFRLHKELRVVKLSIFVCSERHASLIRLVRYGGSEAIEEEIHVPTR
jgi:hypothetical protein